MAEPCDRALIERAQGGDRAAFEALLRAHYDTIYRIAYRWCGNQADDLAAADRPKRPSGATLVSSPRGRPEDSRSVRSR